MRKLLIEFKEFALRGNVMDLAVGVIIGAAFQNIVKSLTSDIISPIIGLFAKTDFSAVSVSVLGVQIRYGSFITAIINFVIMAFVIFLFIKGMNKLSNFTKKKEDEPADVIATKACPFCYSEIPIPATRCPHCTSVLEDKETDSAPQVL